MQCPNCESELNYKDGFYICPSCEYNGSITEIDYNKHYSSYCRVCGNSSQTLLCSDCANKMKQSWKELKTIHE